MHLEIYAANLHHGGGIVSAATLLDHLPLAWDAAPRTPFHRLTILLSSGVADNMRNIEAVGDLAGVDLLVRNDKPLSIRTLAASCRSDIRFTIFGPEYRLRRAQVEVLGFADGMTIRPTTGESLDRNTFGLSLSPKARAARLIKSLLVSRYDSYVVQTKEMATSLARVAGKGPIRVIPNVLPASFMVEGTQGVNHRDLQQVPPGRSLLYPARGYPHKNHQFLPAVVASYREFFGEDLWVVTTLRESEVRQLFGATSLLEAGVFNVGEVSSRQMPALLSGVDGVFFPSQNETFSLTPLEGAFLRKPVIAPDLPYMRLMTKGNFFSYTNGDPGDAANVIKRTLTKIDNSDDETLARLEEAHHWAVTFSDPMEHARTVLATLAEFASTRPVEEVHETD